MSSFPNITYWREAILSPIVYSCLLYLWLINHEFVDLFLNFLFIFSLVYLLLMFQSWIFFEHIFCISYFKYFNCRLLNLFLTPFTLCFPIVHPHSFSFCYVDRFFLFLGWHRNFPPICYKSDDYILSKLIKMLPTSTPKYAYSCHWLVQRASRYSF